MLELVCRWCSHLHHHCRIFLLTFDVFIGVQSKQHIRYSSYVIDVVYMNGRVFIVEFNPFGAEMSSGSALFNWDKDYNIMYGLQPPTPPARVHVRVAQPAAPAITSAEAENKDE